MTNLNNPHLIIDIVKAVNSLASYTTPGILFDTKSVRHSQKWQAYSLLCDYTNHHSIELSPCTDSDFLFALTDKMKLSYKDFNDYADQTTQTIYIDLHILINKALSKIKKQNKLAKQKTNSKICPTEI